MRVSMATNISSTQASAAASAVHSRQNIDTLLSPISSLQADTSMSLEEP